MSSLSTLSFCLIMCKMRLAMPLHRASWHQMQQPWKAPAESVTVWVFNTCVFFNSLHCLFVMILLNAIFFIHLYVIRTSLFWYPRLKLLWQLKGTTSTWPHPCAGRGPLTAHVAPSVRKKPDPYLVTTLVSFIDPRAWCPHNAAHYFPWTFHRSLGALCWVTVLCLLLYCPNTRGHTTALGCLEEGKPIYCYSGQVTQWFIGRWGRLGLFWVDC